MQLAEVCHDTVDAQRTLRSDGACSAAVLDACDMDSRSDRTSEPGVRGSQGTRCRPRSSSQSILRLESEKRTVVQTPVPHAGSSELVWTVRDRSGWQGPLFPIRPWTMEGAIIFLLAVVVGHTEAAEA